MLHSRTHLHFMLREWQKGSRAFRRRMKPERDALFVTRNHTQPHSSKLGNLFKHVQTRHPESYNDSEQKQEDAQTSKSPHHPLFDKRRRVFREAKHILVQLALLLVITSNKAVAVLMFFLCLSVCLP